MPVSTSSHVSHCLEYILNLSPESVLDVGCGFGLWGFLCRMQLDAAQERVQPETWRVRIDGIEYFEPYIQAHQRALYSSIRIGDIRELAASIDAYDLIIAGDVIEHLEREEGEVVLDQLYAKAKKALLVCIPLGLGWDHPEAHGNPQELHRSVWQVEDFKPYPYSGQVFTLPCGKYGVFFCAKNASKTARQTGLEAAAQRCEDAGQWALAAMYAKRLHELDPGLPEGAFYCADLLFRDGKNQEAVAVMESLVAANPGCLEGVLMLAQSLSALGSKEEALRYLETLGPEGAGLPLHLRGSFAAIRNRLQGH